MVLRWGHWSDLNRQPSVYKTGTLPIELQWRYLCDASASHRIHFLPSLTTPVSGRGLIFGGGTLVSSVERLSASGIGLLDGHIRVTESDNLCLTSRTFNIDSGLLRATGGFKGFVEGDLSAFVCSHISS